MWAIWASNSTALSSPSVLSSNFGSEQFQLCLIRLIIVQCLFCIVSTEIAYYLFICSLEILLKWYSDLLTYLV